MRFTASFFVDSLSARAPHFAPGLGNSEFARLYRKQAPAKSLPTSKPVRKLCLRITAKVEAEDARAGNFWTRTGPTMTLHYQYQEITRKLYTISTEPNIPDGSLVNVPTTDEPDGQKKQYQVKLSLVKLSQTGESLSTDNLQLTSGRSPGYSIDSTKSKVIVNTVQVMMADSTIYRYDAIPPDTLSVAMNPKLGDTCRELGVVALGVFFYDGKKNLYSPVWLNSYDGLYKFAIPCQSPQGNHPSTLYTIKVVFASMIGTFPETTTTHSQLTLLSLTKLLECLPVQVDKDKGLEDAAAPVEVLPVAGAADAADAGALVAARQPRLSSQYRTNKNPAAHLTTVGVRRPDYGKAGRVISVIINGLPATIPDGTIYHYDVKCSRISSSSDGLRLSAITPDSNPISLNGKLIKELQDHVAPNIFAAVRAVYDGKKNLYSSIQLNLPNDSANFDVPAPGQAPRGDRPPKLYPIKLTLVNTIGTELLHRFIEGKQSEDDKIKTALQALNIVIKMAPSERYPTKGRSFFTPDGARPIGRGLILWRGYFQSLRPTLGRMLVNVDISTGVMYKDGPLIDVCVQYLELRNASQLSAGMPDRIRIKLQRFLVGLRIEVQPAAGTGEKRIYSIKKVSRRGANEESFQTREGQTLRVADYYRQASNVQLRFPALLCVEVGGKGALIPLERCTVLPGQLFKKEFPDEKRTEMVEFSTQRPKERFQSIRNALQVLQYGQSEYIRKFGMNISSDLITSQARVLQPPRLKYGGVGAKATVDPRGGSWNMADKKFIEPAGITYWVLAICDPRFPDQAVDAVAKDLVTGCKATGMNVQDPVPVIRRMNPQGNLMTQLNDAGGECNRTKGPPVLFVVVLPDLGNADIYNIVKHWGDVRQGVATQCLKSKKCGRANAQYWANVALKINVKRGGVNVITDPSQVGSLYDPHLPTVVMGADVMHPPPGATDRPSFAAMVSSVDANAAKYVATLNIQRGRQELIPTLGTMTEELLNSYMGYRAFKEKLAGLAAAPKRLIFYRVLIQIGASLARIDEDYILAATMVLLRTSLRRSLLMASLVCTPSNCTLSMLTELPLIKQACQALKINPKITLIIVGKRHHFRFLAANDKDVDRSGNCPAGTVVDRDIGHPLELDFYLQSHAGILGTSRPAHYSVLYDENNLSPDALQSLSFALCHVYARATRSVSIPAPVYYADIVCARAKHHFSPGDQSETVTHTTDPEQTYQALEAEFKRVHANQKNYMYFSVRPSCPFVFVD
ncbi:ribonuclease H-like domain-containing protein [Mycena amicta]|nr:ribonuclease H-like domain-containing protein [Mycena amicta]